jgi:hypothetical protein
VLDMTLDDFLIGAGRHGLYAIDYDGDDFQRELDTITKDRHRAGEVVLKSPRV